MENPVTNSIRDFYEHSLHLHTCDGTPSPVLSLPKKTVKTSFDSLHSGDP